MPPRAVAPAALLALCCATCGPPDTAQPMGWADAVPLATVMDLNPDPHVVEVRLDARVVPIAFRPGDQPAMVWTYNGTVPGPLIRAHAGDRVIVHFTNHLPETTTIHWHGLRVPNAMDGAPEVQPPVAVGGSFDYDFVVPDAGTFWYHPHVRSSAQVASGLYGAIVVDPAPGDVASAEPPGLGDELVLVLSDVLLNDDGTLGPVDSGGALGDLFGREGNVVLVNGRPRPTVLARRGRRQRWRLINAARTRYFRIALDGHTLVRIGGDGGLRPTALPPARELMLVPGERADVLVTPDATAAPGAQFALKWLPYERGFGTAFAREPEDILYVRTSAQPALTDPPAALPARLRAIDPLPTAGAGAQSIELTQTIVDGRAVLGINGRAWPDHLHLTTHVGATEVWTVRNSTMADHPFHLHGFFFQVLDGGDDTANFAGEWKDSLNIPAMQTRTFVVRYDDRPGMWMFHCHILDHAESGMMAMLEVMP